MSHPAPGPFERAQPRSAERPTGSSAPADSITITPPVARPAEARAKTQDIGDRCGMYSELAPNSGSWHATRVSMVTVVVDWRSGIETNGSVATPRRSFSLRLRERGLKRWRDIFAWIFFGIRCPVLGNLADDDLVARKQRLAPRPGDAGDAALSTWGSFLWIIARGFKLSTNLPPRAGPEANEQILHSD